MLTQKRAIDFFNSNSLLTPAVYTRLIVTTAVYLSITAIDLHNVGLPNKCRSSKGQHFLAYTLQIQRNQEMLTQKGHHVFNTSPIAYLLPPFTRPCFKNNISIDLHNVGLTKEMLIQ